MSDIFGAMIDTRGSAALAMRQRRDNTASVSKPWAVFSTLLMEKAPSCQALKDLLRPDFDALTGFELYDRIKDTMKQDNLAKEVLGHLDLDETGRKAKLKSAAFEVPSLSDRRI